MKSLFRSLFQPLVVFYVLVAYILATFFWWSTLHFQKNEVSFNDNIYILGLEYKDEGKPVVGIAESKEYLELVDKKKRQDFMIVGEGMAFLLILALGIFRIHSGFRKELMLNRQQRNFLLSITHELKSPIASIKLALQTLAKRKLSEENRDKLVNNSLQDTERLKNLVNNLLMAAKLDGESVIFAQESQNLSNILVEIVNGFQNKHSKERVIDFDIDDGLMVLGDRTALSSVFINLVENAIKYSERGDAIFVNAFLKDEKVIVKVLDTGLGIEEEEKKKIFKKFYRVGNEDTRKTKGTGLGLFIVRQLIKLHQGSIWVSNNQPKGSVFSITLPRDLSIANNLSEEVKLSDVEMPNRIFQNQNRSLR